MMNDLECPYCGEWLEVCHDDGFGYEEGVRHEMECSNCEKNFVFETSIIYHYEPHKADCLNGEPHNLEKAIYHPNFYPDRVRCKNCDYEDKGEMDEKAYQDYFARLNELAKEKP
jgi:hypothetical protein